MSEAPSPDCEINQILLDFSSKKYRNYSPQLEEIVKHFIDLSSNQLTYRALRDILVNYKIICQNSSVASIQRVFEYAITTCQQKMTSLSAEDVDQIEDLDIPFAECSHKNFKDLRFTWEIYKTIMDILKNNNKFEDLFAKVIRAAFSFCVQFDRKCEFKRLCDFLHGSLNSMIKSNAAAAGNAKASYFSINLSLLESSSYQVDIRMAEVNSAIHLGCWNEAFKVLEDLQVLFSITKKSLPSVVLLDYFRMVFSVLISSPDPNYQVLSCATLLKCLGIVVGKGLWQGEKDKLRILCDRILLSFMSIPIFVSTDKLSEDERFMRIASFIGLQSIPTRQSLQKDISVMKGSVIFTSASQSLVEQFKSFDHCEDFGPLMKFVSNENYLQFASFIEQNLNVILLKNILLSNTCKDFDLKSLIRRFPSCFIDQLSFERFLIVTCKDLFNVRILIDHSTGKVHLTNDLSLFLLSNCLMNPSESEKNVTPNNSVCSSENLIILNKDLHSDELEDLLTRCKQIEERKEKKEQFESAREQEQYRILTEKIALEQEQEKARLAEESRKREAERLRREREAVEKDELKKLIGDFIKKCENSGKKFPMNPGECLARKDFIQKQLGFLQSDKQEMDQRMSQLCKQINYTDRAIRMEEIPILKSKVSSFTEQRRETYKEMKELLLASSKNKYDSLKEKRSKISSATSPLVLFKESIISSRTAAFETKLCESKAALELEKQTRIAEINKKRQEAEAAKEAHRLAFPSLRDISHGHKGDQKDSEPLVIQSPFLSLGISLKSPTTAFSGESPASIGQGSTRGKRFDSSGFITRSSIETPKQSSETIPIVEQSTPKQSAEPIPIVEQSTFKQSAETIPIVEQSTPKPGKYDPSKVSGKYSSVLKDSNSYTAGDSQGTYKSPNQFSREISPIIRNTSCSSEVKHSNNEACQSLDKDLPTKEPSICASNPQESIPEQSKKSVYVPPHKKSSQKK